MSSYSCSYTGENSDAPSVASETGSKTSETGNRTAVQSKHTSEEMILLHEATLQDLLRCGNQAILRILGERNELLRERKASSDLSGGEAVEFAPFNYLHPPPPPPLPYSFSADGQNIVRYHLKIPVWARYPRDGRLFNAGTQTDPEVITDPDTTLNEVGLGTLDQDTMFAEHGTRDKKRKLCDH